MTVESSCPDGPNLERLLLGLLSQAEAATLEHHVEGCDSCLARMRSLRADDGFLADLRSGARALDWDTGGNTALLANICRLAPRPASWEVKPPQELTEPTTVAGYRLLRLLGHGGMGVVYLARDERLKRTVAIKMLRLGSDGHPERLARFRREVELIARLRHPNVVSVYEAGEHRGRPFLAMEYVEGGTLAQKLTASALPARTVAEWGEALAGAIHAAHEKGVVHRDLKPANILLGTQDSVLGTPKITDFGLAKPLAPTPDDSSETWDTQPGAILGTPSYMAPEQASASREVGPAADVYALGAILYECLAGRPPFKAATPIETLEQVRTREPAPPRRLQPGIPRDLETICLRCLQKEPHRRYASAQALAEDLRRFLDGKPVLARPTPVWERVWKWSRRRPALATLMLVTGLGLLGMVAGLLIHNARLRAENERTEQQRQRADANYRHAREALTRMLASATARKRAGLPRMQELRREQQEAALKFYLEIAEQPESRNPEVRSDVAQACLEAGRLQMELGRKPESRDNLERALNLFAGLAAEFPGAPRYRFSQAQCLNALGNWHGLDDRANEYHREALALQERLAQEAPDSAENRIVLAGSLHSVGTVVRERKEWEEADRLFLQAVSLRLEVLRERPEDVEVLAGLAQTYLNLSATHQQQKGHRAKAQEFHDLAATTLGRLIDQDPHDFTSITALATLRLNWAYMLAAEGQTEPALVGLGENVTLLEKALRQEPNHATVRDRLFRTHGVRAQLLEGQKRYREELADRKRVVELLDPGADRDYQRLFLAQAYARSGAHANAFAEVETLAAHPPRPASYYQQFYHLAGVCVIALPGVRDDQDLTPSEREARTDRYAAKAVELLGKAREAAGPAEWKKLVPGLLADEAFKPLQGRTDFQRLVKE